MYQQVDPNPIKNDNMKIHTHTHEYTFSYMNIFDMLWQQIIFTTFSIAVEYLIFSNENTKALCHIVQHDGN